jgi:hypothetical protein
MVFYGDQNFGCYITNFFNINYSACIALALTTPAQRSIRRPKKREISRSFRAAPTPPTKPTAASPPPRHRPASAPAPSATPHLSGPCGTYSCLPRLAVIPPRQTTALLGGRAHAATAEGCRTGPEPYCHASPPPRLLFHGNAQRCCPLPTMGFASVAPLPTKAGRKARNSIARSTRIDSGSAGLGSFNFSKAEQAS